MMAKFRKKPVVIEAVRWYPVVHPSYTADMPTLKDSASVTRGWPIGMIETLEGRMFVHPGDWIITGVKGERYPCKPDIFELTYEAVAD